jgi:hypothetical protein
VVVGAYCRKSVLEGKHCRWEGVLSGKNKVGKKQPGKTPCNAEITGLEEKLNAV